MVDRTVWVVAKKEQAAEMTLLSNEAKPSPGERLASGSSVGRARVSSAISVRRASRAPLVTQTVAVVVCVVVFEATSVESVTV